jgi:poly(3-hydroxyalkanoate) synthetase
VTCPLLVVTFEHDSIVPRASALPLLERAGSSDKHELHLSGGHVGAVVSRGAVKKLWPAMSEFWAKREPVPAGDAPPTRTTPRRSRPAPQGRAAPRRRSTR